MCVVSQGFVTSAWEEFLENDKKWACASGSSQAWIQYPRATHATPLFYGNRNTVAQRSPLDEKGDVNLCKRQLQKSDTNDTNHGHGCGKGKHCEKKMGKDFY